MEDTELLDMISLREPQKVRAQAASAASRLPTELIELILLELPIPKVLEVQRVSKTWNSIIKESGKIQRALFLKPALGNKESCFKRPGSPKDPTMCPCFWPHTDADDKFWMDVSTPNHELPITPLLNPLLKTFFCKEGAPKRRKFRNGKRQQIYINALCKGGGSWKKMLILSPPVMVLHYSYEMDNGSNWDGGTIKNEDGVTIGDVVDHYMCISRAWEERIRYTSSHCGFRDKSTKGGPCLQFHGFGMNGIKVLEKASRVWEVLAQMEEKKLGKGMDVAKVSRFWETIPR